MTTKYGMFIEHQYLKPGGAQPPYLNSDKDELALNFKVTAPRTGKNNDATFDKFKSLHEGDRFVDPARQKLLANLEAKKHTVGGEGTLPFKAVSPMKASSGLGDYFGTLGGKVEYVPGATLKHEKKKGEVAIPPRGFYTSPAKKGTYGYNKTTLSERQGPKGVATEYEYHADPLALQKAKIDAQTKKFEGPAFRPSNPPKKGGPGVPNTTISKGKGVAGEWEYILGQDYREVPEGAAAGAADDTLPKIDVPFKPASLKTKYIGQHPEYIHDPEAPKMERVAAAKKAEREKLASSGPWRPNMSYKTDMVRSIIRMNI